LGNFSNPPLAQELREAQAAADRLGIEMATVEIRRAEDIRPAFDALKGAEALYLANDQLILSNRTRINIMALVARLPTIYNSREYVEAGGLVSYGPNFVDLFRRSADLVDKILRGAKAGDLPVEQPTKLDLVINLTTANALGLTIPESFLLRADELIE
jgi:putative ABC transport system substrate-binding protein